MSHAPGLDVSNIDCGEWPWCPSPAGPQRQRRFGVVIRQSALNRLHAHGRTSLALEVGGALIGQTYRDDIGPWLHIAGVIEGESARSAAAQVTFTSDTWTHFHDRLEIEYPGLRIVGWYHTHPGYGCFLSEMDVFIHRGFFDLPWQVAWVFDPVRLADALFAWRADQPDRDTVFIEPDVPAQVFAAASAAKPRGWWDRFLRKAKG